MTESARIDFPEIDLSNFVECYRLGANSYQIKAVNYDKFSESIYKLVSYWITTAILPRLGELKT